jgi:hypothetical protein
MKTEVAVDSYGRVSLNMIRKQDHRRYLAEECEDGTIILTPAARVPALKVLTSVK